MPGRGPTLLSCGQWVPKATSHRLAGHPAALTRMPRNWSQPGTDVRGDIHRLLGVEGTLGLPLEKEACRSQVFCFAIWTQTQIPPVLPHCEEGTQAGVRHAGSGLPAQWGCPLGKWLSCCSPQLRRLLMEMSPRLPEVSGVPFACRIRRRV